MLTPTFEKPYYAVIFTSRRTNNVSGYEEMSNKTMEMVHGQEGFLGADSWRNEEGIGVTISYWKSLDSIKKWKNHTLHMAAAKLSGKEQWYSEYTIRICKVEEDSIFSI